MDFVVVTEPENVRDGPVGPVGRELAFWVPDDLSWTQLNYGQGEGQVEINGCEWGFYFTDKNELTIVLHRGIISVRDAVNFVDSVAAKMLNTPEYQLIFRGADAT